MTILDLLIIFGIVCSVFSFTFFTACIMLLRNEIRDIKLELSNLKDLK